MRALSLVALLLVASNAGADTLLSTIDVPAWSNTRRIPTSAANEPSGIRFQFLGRSFTLEFSEADEGSTIYLDREFMGDAAFIHWNDSLLDNRFDLLAGFMPYVAPTQYAFGANSLADISAPRLWTTGSHLNRLIQHDVTSSFAGKHTFRGTNTHLTRIGVEIQQFEYTLFQELTASLDRIYTLDVAFHIYGDVGELPEPSTAILMLAFAALPLRRR